MTKHIMGDMEFRCIHKKEADHFYFIETQLRAADAIIVSTPIYNLLPAGILIRFLNKLHSSGDYRLLTAKNPKVGAAITVGGTDWTNFGMPIAMLTAMELCGSFSSIVDQLAVTFNPSRGAVILDDQAMAGARRLGGNIASALKNGGEFAYKGEKGVCPLCHGNLLELRGDGIYCPTCEIKGDATIKSGKLEVSFTDDAIGKSRWGEWGQNVHIENITKGHKKATDGKKQIDVIRKEYAKYKEPLTLPKIEE
jgi:multimeric flavodoxin WrbA